MPNWCTNALIVSGSAKDMDKWRIALANELNFEPHLSFSKLFPYPKDSNLSEYSWNIQNWGTKWDVSYEKDGVLLAIEPHYSELNEAVYDFDTAWSPPTALIHNIAKNFPGITFELSYYESGEVFAGKLIVTNGEVIQDISYNDMSSVNDFVIEEFNLELFSEDDINDWNEEWGEE